jgi:NAD+ synthase
MDLCLYAHDHGIPPEIVANAVELSPGDVARVFGDIEQKRRATRYLHLPPQLVSPIPSLEKI